MVIDGFGFNQHDLDANRDGRLTDRQVERVRREYERRRRLALWLLLLGPPLVISIVVAGGGAGGADNAISLPVLIGIVYTVTLLLIVPVVVIGFIATYVRAIRDRAVRSTTAKIRLVPRGDDVHLQVGSITNGPRFALDQDQAAGLTDGERYTVYFTPGGQRSVFHSIEPAPEASESAADAPVDDESAP
ncbi:MAG: hypothetical protein AAF467_23515 [Actinomycetota bacterium]